MSQNKIESRRAFMKKLGKLAGVAAVAAPFMAMAAKEAVAAPDADNPTTCTCSGGCDGGCSGNCSGPCQGQCQGSCGGTCSGTCGGTCRMNSN